MKILIIDDHELVRYATINILRQQYPDAEIFQAQTSLEAINQVRSLEFNLIVIDLVIPENRGSSPRSDTGIQLLKTLMQHYLTLNIVVQSCYLRSLLQLKQAISDHEGGFTVVDKSLPMNEMLTKVEWAIKGVIYTPKEIRSGLEVKPEWLKVLHLAFDEGLQDMTIAKRMNVQTRAVRYYWTKIQDVLEVYPVPGQNLRIQTHIRAKEQGLIH
ncbi:MAG: response regulator transcription factor [Rhizonema sp. PD37]|nr:response regulator transcription factor [Rhizonema sp. PD37]